MRAGELRHLIQIQSDDLVAGEQQDAYGEPVPEWETNLGQLPAGVFAEVWAAKQDLSGQELFAAQQVKGELVTRFTIRYLEGVTSKMRVRCDGFYNIQSVNDPDGKKAVLILNTVRTNA